MLNTHLGTRVTAGANAYAHWTSFRPVVRADLTSARRIVALMANDLRVLVVNTGAVDHDDLVLAGWTAAQIAAHFTAAKVMAERQSLRG